MAEYGLGAAIAIALLSGGAGHVGAQSSILRSQLNPTLNAIQNQIREAVRPRLTIRNPAGPVQSISLSKDGRLLAVTFADNTLRLFDLQAGTQRVQVTSSSGQFRGIAVSSDDRVVVAAEDGGAVEIFDARNGEVLRAMRGHSGTVNAVAVSDDNRFVASAGSDATVRLWDLKSGQLQAVLTGASAPVLSVAISSDGSKILAGATDGRALLWNGRGRAPVILSERDGAVDSAVIEVGFDSTGRSVTTDAGGFVRVWAEAGAGAPRVFRSMQGITGAALTGDGHYVATGDEQGRASIADLSSSQLVKEFDGPSGSSRYVLLDIQHRRLITGGQDGLVRIWNIDSGANLGQIIATINGWAVLDDRGRFDGSQQGVTDVGWTANQTELAIDNFSQSYYEPSLLTKEFSADPTFATAPTPVLQGIYVPPRTNVVIAPGAYLAGQSVDIQVTAVDAQGGALGPGRLYHDGKLVPSDAIVTQNVGNQNGSTTRITVYRIALVPGINQFDAVTASDQNIDGPVGTAQVATPNANRVPILHLVTIGINKYRDSRLNLDYGSADAAAILHALDKAGSAFQKVIDYRLIDEAASRQNIVDLLNALRNTSPDDEVVIYYAGHGEVFGKAWYLIPSDVNTARLQDIIHSSISAEDLRDAISHIGAERILLFVDACKSGGGVETIASGVDRRYLREVARDAGIAILAAARPTQLAAELPSLGHGAFTYVLLQGIAGGADKDPTDGRITADKLLRYSLKMLPVLTEQFEADPQTPVAYRSGSDFFIAARSAGG
jgi:hypothetical protein